MRALAGYNKSSDWQLKSAASTIQNLVSAISHAARLTNSTINICDYGCSEGLNSTKIIASAIQNSRETCQNPIHVFLNDLPSNDWNKLSVTLQSEYSYLKFPNTFASSTARSFFERVLPNESIHVAYSTSSFQYLTRQINSPDSIEACLSQIPEIIEEAVRQGEADMKNLLRLRYEELVAGGRCVFLVHCMPPEDKIMHAQLLSKAHNSLYAKGIISENEYNSFKRPNHYRSNEEWERIFAEVSNMYRVISFETKSFTSPFYDQYLIDGNLDAYIDSIKNFFRPLTQTSFLKSLERTPEEKPEIFQKLLDEIGYTLAENDLDVRVWYSSIVLEKI